MLPLGTARRVGIGLGLVSAVTCLGLLAHRLTIAEPLAGGKPPEVAVPPGMTDPSTAPVATAAANDPIPSPGQQSAPLSEDSATAGLAAPAPDRATGDPATPEQDQTADSALGDSAAWKNSLGIEFVRIEPGEFTMGTTPEQVEQLLALFPRATAKDFDAEQPAHTVRITRPFDLGTHKVTVSQFHVFVEDTGYPADPDADSRRGTGPRPWFPQAGNHPMVNVSWHDARAFCDWLTAREGGRVTYRLPTEAEWEYACRAGTRTLFPNGDDPEKLALIANVADASALSKYPNWKWTIRSDDGHTYVSPVGVYAPNAWGLFDMIGNVWEWCEDHYDHNYYKTLESPSVDPVGPPESPSRSVRGSTWFLDVKRSRPADRGGFAPEFHCGFLGFRLVAERGD